VLTDIRALADQFLIAFPNINNVASTTQVVSAAIVVERQEEGHALPVQRPVYFVSEVLSETKARYP